MNSTSQRNVSKYHGVTILSVCDLVKGTDKKKTFMLIGVINTLFLLLSLFNYSLISLIFLFLFFISVGGTAINLLY